MKQALVKIALFISGLFICISVNSQSFDKDTVMNFEYKIDLQANVELNNQYGDIQIISWEKDSFKLEAKVTATSSKASDIEDLLNRVTINCNGFQDHIVVSTDWKDGVSFLKKSSMDLKTILNTEKQLKIDYTVYLPQSVALTIKNRFGNVYLPDFIGPVRVNISHGDLRARVLKDARNIAVKYGKVLIKSIEKGSLKVEYGSLILDKGNTFNLRSKSSNIEILEADKVLINSRNDELRIDKINSLRGETAFSHLLVKNLGRLIDLNTHYGDLLLKQIKLDFEMIRLEGNNTDYDFEFNKNASFMINVKSQNSKGFKFPIGAKLTEENSGKNDSSYQGNIGSKQSQSKLIINTRNSYINLFYQ